MLGNNISGCTHSSFIQTKRLCQKFPLSCLGNFSFAKSMSQIMSIALHSWLIQHKDAKSSLSGCYSSATEEAVVCWLVSLLEVKTSSDTLNDVSVNLLENL